MAIMARSVAALAIVYACGYVTGALLIDPKHDRTTLSLGIVRLIVGLLLTTIAFLVSLELSLPWFSGPIGLIAIAVALHRDAALVPPRPTLAFRRDGAIAGLIAIVVLSPPLISAMRMAPGESPPVFFNVDIPYFLEKVHSLVGAQAYPPESLSVVDGRRAYHFGIHGLAALISRGSGIAPHHSVFLVVVPLLTVGILAAAVVLARAIAPAVPYFVSVSLLLVSVPTLWYDFWLNVSRDLHDAAVSWSLDPLMHLAGDWQMWGVTSNIQNLAGHFFVLASLAGIANAPSIGWSLPSFLVGSAFLFKSPTGIALVAGVSFAQLCRAVMARSARPLVPALAAAAVFGAIYWAFWSLPALPADLKAQLSPLFHLRYLSEHGGVRWFVMDVAWLLLPALVVLPSRLKDGEKRSLPLLFLAVAPFVVVNLLRLVDQRSVFGIGSMNEDDWRQVMLPVPLLLHAFALSVVARRWTRLGVGFRAIVITVVLMAVLPPAYVAACYARVLVLTPESGHEFADNRSLAEALAVIPTKGTLIVTNDLRYPAEGFWRDNRQMQIPALFGHQAFAVNYVYEAYVFSEKRRGLQRLLQSEQWTPAIEQAARTNRWTHLLIRNDYTHPEPIPLERIFDNGVYSVFRFGTN